MILLLAPLRCVGQLALTLVVTAFRTLVALGVVLSVLGLIYYVGIVRGG